MSAQLSYSVSLSVLDPLMELFVPPFLISTLLISDLMSESSALRVANWPPERLARFRNDETLSWVRTISPAEFLTKPPSADGIGVGSVPPTPSIESERPYFKLAVTDSTAFASTPSVINSKFPPAIPASSNKRWARAIAASILLPCSGISSGDKAGISASIFLGSSVSGLTIWALPAYATKPNCPSLNKRITSISSNRALVMRSGFMSVESKDGDRSSRTTKAR